MNASRRRKVIHAVIQSLKAGSSLWDGCKKANVDYSTFWLWKKKWPRLELICERVYESRIGMVEDALFKNCIQGNFAAQAYFLNNRTGKWKSNEGIKVLQQTTVQGGQGVASQELPPMRNIFVGSPTEIPSELPGE